MRKTYGTKVAVDDVSFDVRAGEIFGSLGPNGAGKTTTVECLQGLRSPDTGTMRVPVTHFMDEAEYLCGPTGGRRCRTSGGDRHAPGPDRRAGLPSVVRFSTSPPDRSWCEDLEVVTSIARRGDAVDVLGTGPVLAMVASAVVARQIVPTDLRVERPTVEDAFLP